MRPVRLQQEDPPYPVALKATLGDRAPSSISCWGNLDMLANRKLSIFSSLRAPGSIILQAHDLAQSWRQHGPSIVSGFHSPVENEYLAVLLRGPQPVIICPARSLDRMRLKPEYKEPMAAGRLLLLSPFKDGVRRPTVETASSRNRFAAALTDSVLIAHAQPGSKTEQLAREVIGWGKPVYTLENPANDNLFELGARPVGVSWRREATDAI